MEFRGKYWFLSNMYPCAVTISCPDGKMRTFKCAEAAYQACKCNLDIDKFVDLDGFAARKLGRQLKMNPAWFQMRVGYMSGIVSAKFMRNPDLAEKLCALEGHIQEDNTWGDTFWGVCNGVGENHLGKLLMEIRDMNSKPQYRIYTTYFANLRNVPENSVVVSIAQFPPRGINIPCFKELAPTPELLTAYKKGQVDEQGYTSIFMDQLANLPNLAKIKAHMAKYIADQDKSLVFVCYEGKNKFCHRHLVAQFFSEFGITEL